MTATMNLHRTNANVHFSTEPKPLKQGEFENRKSTWQWLFKNLTPILQDQVMTLSRVVDYGAREEIFHEGEPTFGFYYISKGTVKLSKRTSSGKKMILRVFSAGEILGVETVFGGDVYDCHAETMTPTTLHFIERRAFLDILRESPDMAIHFIEQLSQDMRMFESKLVETAYEGSNERVANLLLRLAERYGLPTADGTDVGLELKRGELAQMAGLTTETTIRTLRKFEQRGWVQLQRNRVRLLNLDAIENLAEDYLEPVASPEMASL